MKQVKHAPSKKRYETPKFHFYGNIRELTQTVGNTGDMDMQTGSSKTMI